MDQRETWLREIGHDETNINPYPNQPTVVSHNQLLLQRTWESTGKDAFGSFSIFVTSASPAAAPLALNLLT